VATRNIGLDIGSTFVRAAEVEISGRSSSKAGTATLLRYAELPLPTGAVGDGEVHEVNSVASILKRLWAKGKFSSRNVITGVGNQRVVVREMDVPSLPMTQLRQALPFQVQEMLPMSADEAQLDFYPTSENDAESGKVLRGVMVAASKATIAAHVLTIDTAKLAPRAIDLNAFALLRAQAVDDWASTTVAFVDVGARTTNVIIAANKIPRLVRMLPSGGNDATDAVAGALKISAQDAERAKREIGVGFSVAEQYKLGAEALATTTRALVEAIRNTFVFYSQNNPGAPIQHVAITGGGAHLPGFGQSLASAVRLPVSFGDGLARVRVSKKLRSTALEGRESLVAVCVGLALGEVS
jgi:type IV pilus assembly protein PilM